MTFTDRLKALGDAIDAAWRTEAYADAAFDSLAVREIERANLVPAFSLDALLEWLAAQPASPQQTLGGLGSPAITFYVDERFSVRIELRHCSLSSIHDHTFHGVQQILQGAGLYTYYSFEPLQHHGEEVLEGTLTFKNAETLTTGQITLIGLPPAFIHRACNLTPFQAVLRVLTRPHPDRSVYQYLPHGLAYRDWQEIPRNHVRAIDMIRLLYKTRNTRLNNFLIRLISRAQDRAALEYLLHYRSICNEQDLFLEMFDILAARHPRGWYGCFRRGYLSESRDAEMALRGATAPPTRLMVGAHFMIPDGAMRSRVLQRTLAVDTLRT